MRLYTPAPVFKESTIGFTRWPDHQGLPLFFLRGLRAIQEHAQYSDIIRWAASASTIIGITPYRHRRRTIDSPSTASYGFDAGALASSGRELEAKDTVKLDWNINNKNHRASVRYTKTPEIRRTGSSLNFFPTALLPLSTNWYSQDSKTIETVVGQWFADWSPNFD
jgi:hypothetical protein